MHPVSEMLRGVDLTPTQYNALRILRQVGEDGLPCREIGSRMITRDPDVTRLLDRLELRGLVIRSRDPRDRRVVRARATDEGVSLVNSLDDVMQRCHERQFGELDADELRSLNDMLERIRTMRGSDPA
ncbi:MAG: MarR family transcriptional regulator [Acidobacteriota bacterium]